MSTEATTETTPQATTAQPPQAPETPAAPPPAEAAPEAPKAPEAPPPLPPRAQEAMKTLLQKESEVRRAQEELKQREAQIRQEAADEVRRQLKEDPFGILAKEGLSFSELVKRQVEQKTAAGDPLSPVKTELEQIKAHLAERQRMEEETRRQAALQEVEQEVVKHVDSGDYPLIKAAGAQKAVYQEMLNHYYATGETLSEAQVAAKLESNLRDLAAKLTAVVGTKSEVPAPEVKSPAPTLTNNLSTTSPTRVKRPLTEEEELAEMKRALRFIERS